MSRTVPGGSSRQQIANRAPSEKSDTGPAALTAIRRRRGSNHASEVSTNAYGKIAISLKPARSTRRPNDAIVSPCGDSCTHDDAKRPSRNTRPPRPNLLRDHERRPVAPGDQVDEHADARDDERRRARSAPGA